MNRSVGGDFFDRNWLGEPKPSWSDWERLRFWRQLAGACDRQLQAMRAAPDLNENEITQELAALAIAQRKIQELETGMGLL